MTAPNRSFYLTHEAWYADSIPGGDTPEIMVSSDGWEFGIRLRMVGAIRVEVFDDAFDAFVEAADLFQALAERAPTTIAETVEILTDLGFADATARVHPNTNRPPRPVEEEQRLRALIREATAGAVSADITDLTAAHAAVTEVPLAEWTCTACQGDLMWDTALGWVDWSSATPERCPRNGDLGHVYSAASATRP